MKRILGLFLFSILLMGCQEASLEEPQKETEIEQETDAQSVYETNEKPRRIDLYIGANETPILPTLLSYCWNEQLEECHTELTYTQEELETASEGRKISAVSPGKEIKFLIDANPSIEMPFPDSIELFLMIGEELTPVPVNHQTFLPPEQEGSYTYLCKTTFESDIKGSAFYAFTLRVRK
jgi:hypothetical protein